MGNESVAALSTELLSFNGHYSVPLSANPASIMLDDAACALSSAMAILKGQVGELEENGGNDRFPEMANSLWGAYHLMQIAYGLANGANCKIPAEH
jgi:hypothetical protein